jgi:HD-GYP domain-containing protein (c-di-GMP phosphodiesterase class II)
VADARLAEIVASLSLATEPAAGVPPETAARAALLAVEIAAEVGLAPAERRDVFYATLLRYIGCSGFAHETAWYGAGDDVGLLRALTPMDEGSPRSVLSSIVGRVGRGAGAANRARSVVRVLSDPTLGGKIAAAHCEQAVHLAAHLGLGARVIEALGQMYERWDGKGGPCGLAGDRIAILPRVMRVALCMELHRAFEGAGAAVEVLLARRGGELDPSIVDAVSPRARDLVAMIDAPSVWDPLLAAEPVPHERLAPARVGDLALAFARFVDLKSPFTLSHSTGVATLCAAALERCGASPEERENGRISALLHDLGRASVSNGIWDKPAALGPLERERVQQHVTESERVLSRTPLLAPYVAVVGAHHERLDGSGYPRRAMSSSMGRVARVLAAADVCHALGEDRAHRPALSSDAIARTMADEAKAGRLDRDAVEAVLAASGRRVPRLRGDPPAGLTDREIEVLRLLARGLSNKEIGKRLFISGRTVGHHVAHLYEKTGVRTRAAAALFAVEHDLVER